MANLKEINEMLDDLARRTELTQQEKENTRNRLVRIEQKEQKEEAARVQLEDAKEKGEAFEESYNAAKEKVSETVTSDEEKVEDKEETKKTKKEKKNKKDSKLATGIIAGALAASLLLPAGHFAAKGIVDAIRGNKDDDKDSTSTIQEYEIDESKDNALAKKFREFLVKKGVIQVEEISTTGRIIVIPLKKELSQEEVKELADEFFADELFVKLLETYDIENEELNEDSKIAFCVEWLKQMGINTNKIDVAQDIEEIKTASPDYSTESFEEIVEDFSEEYVENNVSVSTEDLTKFNVIMLIDQLCEENPELVNEVFGVSTKEEFLNDAAKVIGVTYMYNHQIWDKEQSTENFIWISDGIHENDPQREKMEEIEEYVRKIAEAASKDNADEVNKIFLEFLEALTSPTGSLNALDDGTEFAAQIWLALINNSIGRNYLTQESRDYLNERSSSETNVSNIFTQIEECKVRVRTLG